MPRRSPILWPLAIAALVASCWATRFAHCGSDWVPALGGDLWLYYYPAYEAGYRWLAAGLLPLWNPYQLCGSPWLATLQGAFLYPPHVVYLLLPTHVALAASALLHLVLLAVTMALFCRRAGLHGAAALLASTQLALRGVIPSLLAWPYLAEAAAWLPLGAIGVLELARGTGGRAAALVALAAGMSWLAGGPQATVFLHYAWATLLIALLLADAAPRRRWVEAGGAFAGALALGGLVAAVQLLPAFELLRDGARGAHQLPASAMFPQAHGSHASVSQALGSGRTAFGVVGLALIPAALSSRRQRSLAVWALVLAGLAFLFALGPLTPFFGVYLALPGVGWFRAPIRILLLADFGFAILAAIGLDTLLRASGTPGRRRVIVASSVAAALILCAHHVLRGAYGFAMLAAAAAAIVALGAATRAPFRPWLIAVGLPVLAVVHVFLVPCPPLNQPFPYWSGTPSAYAVHEGPLKALGASAGADRVWFYGPSLARLTPKLATLYRVRSVDDYEPMVLRRQSEYFVYLMDGAIEPIPRYGFHWLFDSIRWLSPAPGRPPMAARRRLLDLAAMRFFAVDEAFLREPVNAFTRDADLEPRPSPGPGLALFENRHALPRAFVVYRVLPAPPSEELLGLISESSFDPLVASYVEGNTGLPASGPTALRGAPAVLVRDEERIVEVDADLAAPGMVVLADSFYPGWRATIDGIDAPIFPTNHLFRGVPVPAGHHRARFEYRPRSFLLGAALSAMAVLALAALALRRGTPSA